MSERSSDILQRSITELDLNARSRNLLMAENIATISELVRHSEVDLLRLPNCGRHTIGIIKAALAKHRLELFGSDSRPIREVYRSKSLSYRLVTDFFATSGCYCSFCGNSQNDVRTLFQGPSVFICNECVVMCNQILNGRDGRAATLTAVISSVSDLQPHAT